jgi:hypothetical protein
MKKKNIISLVIIIIVSVLFIRLIYINYKSHYNIKFGYLECMKLDSGEHLVSPIDSASIHEFIKNCRYDKTEIYLNRVLSGKNKTYIALSTRLSPQEYIQQANKDSLLKIYYSKEFSNNKKLYYSFFIKKNNTYFFRTLYSEPKYGNTILIDIKNTDSLSILKLYNDKNYLINKLNCD